MRSDRKDVVKVVVLGDMGVGKTSLMNRYVKGMSIQNYKSTIGADIFVKDVEVFDGKTITVQIWDTAGQERFDGLSAAYYRGADCCVLVFDVTKPATFDSLDNWRTTFLKDSNICDPKNFPFVVLGNKVDKGTAGQMNFKEVIRWCQANNGIPYFHTSAKDGYKVEDAFQKIVHYAYDYESSQCADDISETGTILMHDQRQTFTVQNPAYTGDLNPNCCQ